MSVSTAMDHPATFGPPYAKCGQDLYLCPYTL